MLGDVAGAFRHVPLVANAGHMFGFRFDEFLITDLSFLLPFTPAQATSSTVSTNTTTTSVGNSPETCGATITSVSKLSLFTAITKRFFSPSSYGNRSRTNYHR
ncbi:Hypothetical protein PHPALM_14279 [Phytophthora palmivora]|uniref:Uncharacterized protein n=1 Tax=Phytophthora palmivora TaxID=4796 RepID=A0A2P4XV44_9STRA|nr:Hypothetical protein PHPALM_14279 [Phytophthora palmivora]